MEEELRNKNEADSPAETLQQVDSDSGENEVTLEGTDSDGQGQQEDSQAEQDLENAVSQLSEENLQLKKEREELVNQLLRLKADFANYKRRSESQIKDIQQKANEELIKTLLPVVDDFEQALKAVQEDSQFVSGMRMIRQKMVRILEEQGLQAIPSEGEAFDPQVHEPISISGESSGDMIVSREMRKGYLYKGKVIRPSMVEVTTKQQEKEDE